MVMRVGNPEVPIRTALVAIVLTSRRRCAPVLGTTTSNPRPARGSSRETGVPPEPGRGRPRRLARRPSHRTGFRRSHGARAVTSTARPGKLAWRGRLWRAESPCSSRWSNAASRIRPSLPSARLLQVAGRSSVSRLSTLVYGESRLATADRTQTRRRDSRGQYFIRRPICRSHRKSR